MMIKEEYSINNEEKKNRKEHIPSKLKNEEIKPKIQIHK